jgi:hypothetical protein
MNEANQAVQPSTGLSRLSLVSVTMAHHRGDDLDDDFLPDETVALSEDDIVGDHDDIGNLLSADEDERVQVDTPKERSDSLLEKKRRRRAKEKERRAKAGFSPHYRYPKHELTRDNRSENLTRLLSQVTAHLWRRSPPP